MCSPLLVSAKTGISGIGSVLDKSFAKSGEDFAFLSHFILSSVCSGGTLRMVTSGVCILAEDFEALRFAKNDLEVSRVCLGESVGELGNGGSEVKVGDLGELGDRGGCGVEE